MTVKELASAIGCETVTGGKALQNEIKGGYCGDLLSWVMGRAGEGSAWVTVMGNVNAVAVAVLAGVACMVLVQGAGLDAEARKKAEENGVAVLKTEEPAYETAVKIYGATRG